MSPWNRIRRAVVATGIRVDGGLSRNRLVPLLFQHERPVIGLSLVNSREAQAVVVWGACGYSAESFSVYG